MKVSLYHTLFAVLLPLFLRYGNRVQAELIEKHLFTITVYPGIGQHSPAFWRTEYCQAYF